MTKAARAQEPILIKKYGNRRLYDTSRSRYITLEDLAGIVREGSTVKVVEASTDRDLTRTVLLQVLLEQQEALNLVPVELLHAVLRVQGTLEQAPFAAFLSASTRQFLQQGNQVAQQFMNLLSGFSQSPSPSPSPSSSSSPSSSPTSSPSSSASAPSAASASSASPPSSASSPSSPIRSSPATAPGSASSSPPQKEPEAEPQAGTAAEAETPPAPPGRDKGNLQQVRARMDRLLGKLNR
jgi:polyhydroxyalkanoate synthesis repressor PhaR